MNLGDFNANEQEAMRSFDPLPHGRYLAVIASSEERQTKTGTGSYLYLEFQVIEGEYVNRKLFVNLNLNNSNAETVRIARAELGAICKAVGVITPKDSSELHDLPLTIDVRSKRREDNGELQNKIAGYYPKGEIRKAQSVPPAAVSQPTTAGTVGAAGAPRTAGAGKAPWAR